MAKEKAPPPHSDHPDYNPDAPTREELGDPLPQVDQYEPERNRSAPSVAVLVTVVLVVLLAVVYFLARG